MSNVRRAWLVAARRTSAASFGPNSLRSPGSAVSSAPRESPVS
jgi:hypothetical protein